MAGTPVTAMSPRVLTFVALAVAVLPLGCGQNLEADEFRERAVAICSDTDDELASLARPTSFSPTTLSSFAEQARSVLSAASPELKRVIPPRELTSDYGAMLDHRATAIERLEEVREAAAANDLDGAREHLAGVAEALVKSATAARDVGLGACAMVGSPLLAPPQGPAS